MQNKLLKHHIYEVNIRSLEYCDVFKKTRKIYPKFIISVPVI